MTEYTILTGCISLTVKVLEDVNIPATFAHNAASDIDHHGGRETVWEAVGGKMYLGEYGEADLTKGEIAAIVNANHKNITTQVQWMIDQEDHL